MLVTEENVLDSVHSPVQLYAVSFKLDPAEGFLVSFNISSAFVISAPEGMEARGNFR